MKKGILTSLVVAAFMMGGQVQAADFTNFGADLGGSASFFPNTGNFSYSFSNPYAGIGAVQRKSQLSKKFKPNKRKDVPETQNNLGGTVLVVNANAPVNVKANLQNRGDVSITAP